MQQSFAPDGVRYLRWGGRGQGLGTGFRTPTISGKRFSASSGLQHLEVQALTTGLNLHL